MNRRDGGPGRVPVPLWGGFEGRQAHGQLEALGLAAPGLFEAANRPLGWVKDTGAGSTML